MRVFQRSLSSIEEMTNIELDRSITMLRQFINKKGETHENTGTNPESTESVGDETQKQDS